MKRDDRLRGLSADHHHALVLARRLVGGDGRTAPAQLRRELEEAYARELEPHFALEERVLLPALRAAGERALVERTLAEHAAMREHLAAARGGDDARLGAFGALLGEHVRFEERELFPAAERALPAAVLDEIARAHAGPAAAAAAAPAPARAHEAKPLLKIGTSGPARAPEDAVDLLLACHGRIREFGALARRLGEAEAPPAEQVVDAAARVARYFTEALPLHVRDEDESLAPRLRGVSSEVDAALDALEREHRAHEPLVARLVARCAALRDAPARHAGERDALAREAAALEAAFDEHLAREERVLFPAIRAALPAPAREAILREIRARRTK